MSGSQPPHRPLKAEYFWGLVTVVAVAIVCAIIILVFKKPGQMGVLESQSMNMNNLRPPEGAVPVAVASVDYRPVQGAVTYTGTVESYTDEDVYPRITGRIVNEPVYPGDRVRAGQLLVQLDPSNSEYASKAREAEFAARAEMHNARIASDEAHAKKAKEKASASAQTAAQDALKQAQANLDYWAKEIVREKTLLDQQVVSQQEYDSEKSQYDQAKDQVAQAQAKVGEARQNSVAAADEAAAAAHHTKHQFEQAERAEAEAQTAAIVLSYTKITASGNGIVTKRFIAPGVVVSPGMAILRVAHIDRVRVQAQVSEQDEQRIPLGAQVTISTTEGAPPIATGQITAKFPAAQQATRTFILESLIENPGYRLLPGEYVVMSLATGAETDTLSIPSTAVVWSGNQPQVWKAVGTPPRAIAQLQNIRIGASNEKYTQVLSGLRKGDRVIYEGHSGLTPGTPVVAVEWGATGPQKLPSPTEASGIRMASSNKWTVTEHTATGLQVKLFMTPVPPKNSDNSVMLVVTDRMGMPVKGALIKAATSMPSMNMPGPNLQANETAAGRYKLTTDFMSGLWSMNISLTANGQAAKLTAEADVP